MKAILPLFVLILVLCSACKEDPPITPTPPPPPPVVEVDCNTPVGVDQRMMCTDDSSSHQITVLTFNVLVGGGVDSATYEQIHQDWAFLRKNRLDNIIELLRLLDADIVALQEVFNWDKGDHPVIQQVAEELGYHYWVPEDPEANFRLSGLAFLSKFDILETETLMIESESGWMKSVVQTSWGERLHIFNTHRAINYLDDVDGIRDLVNPFADSLTIVMGDMNFGSNPAKIFCDPPVTETPGCTLWHTFLDGGWTLASSTCNWVDHVYVSSPLSALQYPIYEDCIDAGWQMPSGKTSPQIDASTDIQHLYNNISDHYPTIARVGFR